MNLDLRRLIKQALHEDLGTGDVTSRAVIPPRRRMCARIVAKAPGVVAGARVAQRVFQTLDRRIRCTIRRHEGQSVRAGQTILTVDGPARSILSAERTALNFLGHLSGIATLTHQYVQRVRGTKAAIFDTRKTLPGLRELEKDAVRVGGGQNHRPRLDVAVLIKTNHLRALSTQHTAPSHVIQDAVRQAKRRARRRFVEAEVANLAEFRAALAAQPDAVLLDNWRLAQIKKAVALRNSSLITHHPSPLLEVSGGVTLHNVRAIARAGVDRISIGRLTHSAPALDVSLEVA